MAKYHFYQKTPEHSPECHSLAEVKRLIKKQGGFGYTEHWVKGTFEGTTAINLTGKNDAHIPQHSDNKMLLKLKYTNCIENEGNEKEITDISVLVTIPAAVIEQLLAIKNNENYERNEIINDWLYSQVDTSMEILAALNLDE